MKTKRLIIVRHAHRDKPFGRAFDNGLSPKGRKQAKSVKKFYTARFEDGAELLSSPKLRCVETLEPLAAHLQTEVKIDALLCEEADAEGKTGLSARTRQFLSRWISSKKKLTIACSHGDWIPLFLKEAVGVETELKKGAWAEITLVDGQPRLTWLVQRWEPIT